MITHLHILFPLLYTLLLNDLSAEEAKYKSDGRTMVVTAQDMQALHDTRTSYYRTLSELLHEKSLNDRVHQYYESDALIECSFLSTPEVFVPDHLQDALNRRVTLAYIATNDLFKDETLEHVSTYAIDIEKNILLISVAKIPASQKQITFSIMTIWHITKNRDWRIVFQKLT